MKLFRIVIAVAIAVMVAGAASAQSRGNARIQGKVVDPGGQPIQDVVVKAQMVDQTDLMQAKTNKNGEWRLNGLANGQWKIEFSKEGLDPVRQQFEIRDDRAAPMNITMGKPQPKERSDDRDQRRAPEGGPDRAGRQVRRRPQDLRGPRRQEPDADPVPRLHRAHVRRREQRRRGRQGGPRRRREGAGQRREQAPARRPPDGSGTEGGVEAESSTPSTSPRSRTRSPSSTSRSRRSTRARGWRPPRR